MKVAIFGISGYLGIELIKILSQRKEVEIVYTATSKEKKGKIEDASIALLALPANESLPLVPKILSLGIKVIDLSGAYRLKKPESYTKYFGWQHPHPELLNEAVYGLVENNRDNISKARLIANPGCYATAINLGLLPLVKRGLISQTSKVIIKAMSGYTGAGKRVKIPKTITSYKGGRQHQHIPEVEQELGIQKQLLFYPQIAPWPRGIEVDIYAKISSELEIFDLYKQLYRNEFFVRVRRAGVKTEDVIGTNFCDIFPQIKDSFTIIKVVIDNLGKGGAGQAVQNLNIMCGFPETLVY